jgi:Ca2+-binding RTX toxin-like protein
VDGGDPSASDVLNLTGATGAISQDAANQSVSGYGGTVRHLGVERLSLSGTGGAATLAVTGTSGDDTINLSPTSGSAGSFAVGSGAAFTYSGVAGGSTVNGGTGFDTLAVLGTSSDDTVTSTATTVTINGATVTQGTGLERLSISTSEGNDNITLTGVTLPIIVDAGAGNDSVSGTGVTAAMTIFGGDGNDSIVGGSAIDLIYGGLGNDAMAGGGGNDQVFGDDGDDIFGNPSAAANGVADDTGNDQFFGGSGSDTFFWEPGDGDDLVEGGAGDSDQIQFFGNAGAEQFFVFADLVVQSRLHIFRVQAAIDIDASDIEEVNVTSAGGTDTVAVGRSDTGTLSDLSTTGVRLVNVLLGDDAAADSIVVEGRPLNDNILVSLPLAGNFDLVRMAGSSYDLILEGLDSPASDRLTINGNEGNDEIKAVDGVETAVNITLNGGAGNDVLSADAILSGGDGNDTLKGGSGNDTMDGGNGDDVLVFTAGNDTMTGGAGVDTLRAEGNDTANTINLSQAGTIVTISTGLASGTVDFTGVLSMERIDVFAFGGNDNITVSGVSLPKTIDAGAGNDTVDLSAAVDATILGRDGDDILTGSPAADNIDGGPGNDTLSGLGGVDILNGGDGNDSLTGGTGNDQMFGDAGSDTLVWNNGDGSDLMEGGEGSDTVQVNGSNAAGDAFLITPNGARVRFERTNLGPFTLDIGAAEELTVNGQDGDDAFSVTPLAQTHITINGGNPVPPAAPGDQLNVDFNGALNSIRIPTGVGSGIWSFNNRQSINFTGIETQGPAGPGITINNVAIPEGNAGSLSATFTATLSAASAQTISVDVSTANGTATAPVDYQSANATLTFLPGVTTANFSVPVNGDTTPEGNETFFVNLTNAVNASISTAQGTGTINDDDSTNIFQFSSATANVNENAVPGSATVTVTRTGDLTGAASITFETNDGTAKQKTDYTFGYGTVQFGPGEGSKDVKILVVNDVFIEGAEAFQVSLLNPAGNSSIGSPGTITVTITDDDLAAAPNPIDDTGFFVRQHYLDFLGREPDAPGLAFWTAQITACGGNASCIAAKRVDVSASFFLSIEFQETGGYALRIQRTAFGRQSNDPFTRYPYLLFMRDTRTIGQGVIVGQPGADTLLEQNKQAYANALVATEEFAIRFPSAPAAVYVDALFASAGVTPPAAERTAAINAFGAGGTVGRVAALRSVGDSASVRTAESRVSFVLSEYYGYLRRNPTDAPDFNNAGYQFWLDKLNLFNGNYLDAEMVKAFITSIEYRQRFGP